MLFTSPKRWRWRITVEIITMTQHGFRSPHLGYLFHLKAPSFSSQRHINARPPIAAKFTQEGPPSGVSEHIRIREIAARTDIIVISTFFIMSYLYFLSTFVNNVPFCLVCSVKLRQRGKEGFQQFSVMFADIVGGILRGEDLVSPPATIHRV